MSVERKCYGCAYYSPIVVATVKHQTGIITANFCERCFTEIQSQMQIVSVEKIGA